MDGVLIESLDAKTAAFRQLFREYPDFIEEIISYHMANPGVSRFVKIPYIFENIIRRSLEPELEMSLFSELSGLVSRAMMEVSLVDGCKEFLDRYSSQVPCAVVSAAPEEDVKSILTQKGVAGHFVMMRGYPPDKKQNIFGILEILHIDSCDAIMVGDALTDYYAARETGCRFIGRVQEGQENPFLKLTGVEKIIFNFYDLKAYLTDHT